MAESDDSAGWVSKTWLADRERERGGLIQALWDICGGEFADLPNDAHTTSVRRTARAALEKCGVDLRKFWPFSPHPTNR